MARKVLFASAVAGSVEAFLPADTYQFQDFVQDFGRQYAEHSDEYKLRQGVFSERLSSMAVHNSDTTKTWKRGVNRFADVTREEFKSSLGYNKALARHVAAKAGAEVQSTPPPSIEELPESWDWRERNVVTSVKDQGHCGSCWAFATTETVESHVAIATGTLETLSAQQLVSCAPNPLECGGTGGCYGSIPEVGFSYLQLYGMTTEWMYSYQSYHGVTPSCAFNISTTPSVVQISGYRVLPSNSYEWVMHALAKVGPLAIAVQADQWHDYESGVFAGCTDKTNVDLDHAVQLVGYGKDENLGDYFLVRNSWDTTWGENGYIRIKRSRHDCGTDVTPSDGTGCSGGPATQHVCGECGLLFDVTYPLGAEIVKYGHHVTV